MTKLTDASSLSFVDASRRIAAPIVVMAVDSALAGVWLLLFLVRPTLVATGRTR